MTRIRSEAGFSMMELMVATGLLLVVSAITTNALMQMGKQQQTIWNRTEMHSGIRGATELLQQEVGQAGRIAIGNVTLQQVVDVIGSASAVRASKTCDPAIVEPDHHDSVVQVSSVAGMFAVAGPPADYIMLTTSDGDRRESVRVKAINSLVSPPTITTCFLTQHDSLTVLTALGSFATGIVPPAGIANGSSATVLKMYGDINGDGNMVYIEYTCDTANHKLYRNMMAFDAVAKPAVNDSQILLSNIIDNPGGTPCFTYQTSTITTGTPATPFTFVTDVAVTLTVQTQQIDPITRTYQTETKALLNVSPRNVYDAWMLASMAYTDRIQSTPVSITNLLP